MLNIYKSVCEKLLFYHGVVECEERNMEPFVGGLDLDQKKKLATRMNLTFYDEYKLDEVYEGQ